MDTQPYHHGDLRRAVLQAAVDAINEAGPASVSLRDLARRVGVSHAAPAHHFTDKVGLLTALATDGFDRLADALGEVEPLGDVVESGVAYVSFAVRNRAHFEVMFRTDLLRTDDPDLATAQERAAAALRRSVGALSSERRGTDPEVASVAAWSLVHGFATLWLQGLLDGDGARPPEDAFRGAAALLFRAAP